MENYRNPIDITDKSYLKFFNLMKNLKGKKIGLVFDNDLDGMSSGVIMTKALEAIRGKKPEKVYFYDKKYFSEDFLNKLIKDKIEVLLSLDLSIDNQNTLDCLKKSSEQVKDIKFIVIDHHIVQKKLPSNFHVFKPQFLKISMKIDPSKYNTSKLAYDLLYPLADIKEHAWIASFGIIGDMSYPIWTKFVDDAVKSINMKMSKDVFEDGFGLYASCIAFGLVDNPRNVLKIYKLFLTAQNPLILKQCPFWNTHKILRQETYKIVENKAKYESIINKRLIYHIKSEHDLKSIVSTIISKKVPKQTVIVIQENGTRIHVSARRQDMKEPVNLLLSDAVKDIPDSNAGGHVPAAGGAFPKKYLKKFMENLEKL